MLLQLASVTPFSLLLKATLLFLFIGIGFTDRALAITGLFSYKDIYLRRFVLSTLAE